MKQIYKKEQDLYNKSKDIAISLCGIMDYYSDKNCIFTIPDIDKLFCIRIKDYENLPLYYQKQVDREIDSAIYQANRFNLPSLQGSCIIHID